MQLAKEAGARVTALSVDGVDSEALVPLPRREYAEHAREAADAARDRLRGAGVEADAQTRGGLVVEGVVGFADEVEADLIVTGASARGSVASRLLGTVPTTLIQRARRPVLVVTPPAQD